MQFYRKKKTGYNFCQFLTMTPIYITETEYNSQEIVTDTTHGPYLDFTIFTCTCVCVCVCVCVCL
jgi:hypothetical protein